MHLNYALTNAAAEIIELNVGMIGEERHGNGGIHDAMADHVGTKPLAKGIVVISSMPYRNFLGLPSFLRPNGDRSGWDQRDVAATRGSCVLRDSDRMQVDNACAQREIFGG